jgi:hypothetical protein
VNFGPRGDQGGAPARWHGLRLRQVGWGGFFFIFLLTPLFPVGVTE